MGLFTTDNKMKKYELLLAKAVISYMREKFNIDSHITIRKSTRPNTIGDVSLSDASVNRNRFILHLNTQQAFPYQIKSMLHELTHIKQISKKELKPSDDWKSIIWKDNTPLSSKEYKKIMNKDVYSYNNLPWEKEAIHNMKSLYDDFLQSKHFIELKGKDPNLDFIINSLTERRYIKMFEQFIKNYN